ncbi:hypothetical protein Hanom_Chr12g01108261 [Helianthus anomalus]
MSSPVLTDNVHKLFLEMGTFGSLINSCSGELAVGFSSVVEPELSLLMQQRDQDQRQQWDCKRGEFEYSGLSNGVDVMEDLGLFDQSYCLISNSIILLLKLCHTDFTNFGTFYSLPTGSIYVSKTMC